MPFSQTSRSVWYFGFLTLVDPDTHNELVQDLTKNPIKFGDMELKFEIADSRRSPTKPVCKRKEDNSKEEEVVMLSRKMGSSIPATCFKKIKVELQEPAHILVDSAANDGEGNVERHDLEKRIEGDKASRGRSAHSTTTIGSMGSGIARAGTSLLGKSASRRRA